jgi:cytochrome c553
MDLIPALDGRGALHIGVLIWGLLAGSAAWAQPAAAAPSELQVSVWAASCMACHGTDGRAEGTGLRLQGFSADQIYRRLLAFKHGEVSSTIMQQHARGYTDAELALIARRFAKTP